MDRLSAISFIHDIYIDTSFQKEIMQKSGLQTIGYNLTTSFNEIQQASP